MINSSSDLLPDPLVELVGFTGDEFVGGATIQHALLKSAMEAQLAKNASAKILSFPPDQLQCILKNMIAHRAMTLLGC